MPNRSWNLPAMLRRVLPKTPRHTAAPQFPGVEFLPHMIDFTTKDAEEK